MNVTDGEVCILEGAVSVESAIKYKSRKIDLCYVDSAKVKKRDRKILGLLKLLREEKIPVQLCERSVIDSFLEQNSAGAGTTHGGVAAVCGGRRFTPIDDLLEKTAQSGGFCVVLDGVEDPFNFGYSVRNLYAAGACGVIIPRRNWMSAAGVCARASAGATEACELAVMPQADSPGEQAHAEFIKMLRKKGFFTVCAAKTAKCEELFDFEPEFPMVLFIGGEKRGISPEFIENCDSIVCIPYYSDAAYSLPTASTAAIFGFELAKMKQKSNKKSAL